VADETHPALLGEHPDHPGWREWRVGAEAQFNRAVLGLVLVRLDSPTAARTRIFPREMHLNLNGNIHGAIIMSLVDAGMFSGASLVLGKNLAGAVTLEANVQFTGAGDPARPLDLVVEVVRETGRMVFCRGTAVQDDAVVAACSGILRKASKK